MIELQDVHFAYPEVALLQGVNLTLRRGEIALLRGKSGCGKTSFLRLLSRFELPAGGAILLDRLAYGDYPYAAFRSRVIRLHQAPVMGAGTSVRENLLLPFSFEVHQEKQVPDDGELSRMLAAFHLSPDMLHRDAQSLSGGEQQRIAIIRAALLRPDFLLLDEPLSNLDPESVLAIKEWLVGQCSEKLGMVIVSHQPFDDLPQHAVRVLELSGGTILECRG